VGCGPGTAVRQARREGAASAIGIDPSDYDFAVFRLTTEISRQTFPIMLDVDNPRFRQGLERLYAIARAIYLRKIGRGGEGFFDFPVYLGASVEAGNTWQQRGDFGWGGARKDLSLFLGLDTPIGPLYLGSGYDQSGNNSFFMFLGRTF